MSEMKLRSFSCNNCGTPLEIPRNSRGIVVCPSCHTECIIENLVKNQEIANKANINSGLSHEASMSDLHSTVLDILHSSSCAPADVYTTVNILQEEQICVPGYVFHCNGMAPYSYDVANMREHQRLEKRGDTLYQVTEQKEEWSQMQGTATATKVCFVSGNRDMATIIDKLYSTQDAGLLTDIEDLEFNAEVITLNNDLPQTAAFTEFVRPTMEKLLEQNAVHILNGGKKWRNLAMSGSQIAKDEIVRVFLGVYHVVYEYKGTTYDLYTNYDGSQWYYFNGVPVDQEMRSKIDAKQQEMDAIKPTGIFKFSKPIFIVLAVLAVIGLFGRNTIVLTVLAAIAAIVFMVFKILDNKKVKAAKQHCADEIASMKAVAENAYTSFCNAKQAMHGIYEGVTGDPSAF